MQVENVHLKLSPVEAIRTVSYSTANAAAAEFFEQKKREPAVEVSIDFDVDVESESGWVTLTAELFGKDAAPEEQTGPGADQPIYKMGHPLVLTPSYRISLWLDHRRIRGGSAPGPISWKNTVPRAVLNEDPGSGQTSTPTVQDVATGRIGSRGERIENLVRSLVIPLGTVTPHEDEIVARVMLLSGSESDYQNVAIRWSNVATAPLERRSATFG